MNPAAGIGSLLISSAAVVVCWVNHTGAHGFLLRDFFAFSLLLLQQQLSKRLPDAEQRPPQPVQDAAIIVGIGSLWYWVQLWVHYHFCNAGPGSAECAAVTVSWSILGVVVFCIGLFWRERMYRLLGFVILGASVARAVMLSAGEVHALVRSLSFSAIGAALLVTGFLCVAFRERLRERPGAG
ncbi:MAG: DUF2339 domain-containing protein [Verrucomicrobiota bacterium]|nr:DUF2339 domain-containing protein [Verrucomicrobiota bacterium]